MLLALAPEEPACVAARATLVEALAAGALAGTELELRSAGGGSCVLRARAASAAGLVLWTLQDVTPLRRLEAQAGRQRELLDMAQEFGRLGVWERDIATGEGRWDRHVFNFWGLDPRDGTPSHEVAAQHIHPDDRSLLNFPETTRSAGRYAYIPRTPPRYRPRANGRSPPTCRPTSRRATDVPAAAGVTC